MTAAKIDVPSTGQDGLPEVRQLVRVRSQQWMVSGVCRSRCQGTSFEGPAPYWPMRGNLRSTWRPERSHSGAWPIGRWSMTCPGGHHSKELRRVPALRARRRRPCEGSCPQGQTLTASGRIVRTPGWHPALLSGRRISHGDSGNSSAVPMQPRPCVLQLASMSIGERHLI